MNKRNKTILFTLLIGYTIIVAVFGISISRVSTSYTKMEQEYLEKVQTEITTIFNETQDIETLLEQLKTLIKEYSMEVIVADEVESIFSTINLTPSEARESINSDMTLAKSQGITTIAAKEYFVWYNIYHLSMPTYMAKMMQWQFGLIGIAVVILLTLSFAIQHLLFFPLNL